MARVVHFELAAADPERARAFYQTIFEWDIQKWDGPMDYWMVMTGDQSTPGIDGGLTGRSDIVEHTVITVDVPDIEATLAQVTEHGGEPLAPKFPVGEMGFVAYFRDTEGNVIGLWQNAEPGE